MTQPMQPKQSYPQWQRYLGGVGLVVGVTVGMTLAMIGADMSRVLAQTPGVVSEGYALLERGWVNDAIATFREAVQQYPQSVPAQLGLAIAYQRAGQDANAWTAYQRVLAQDPNNKTALAAVGTLGSYRPEWQQQGILALTTLLNLEPQNLDARAQRALLYGYQGQYAESIADYEIALASNPKPAVVLGAAQIYAYSGDYPEALTRFDQYLRTGGVIPNAAITAYALALQETGSADRAVQVLSDRLQSLPQQSPLDATAIQIRAALAVAYQKNNQLDVALTVLQPLQNNTDAALPLARALSAIGRAEGNTDLYGEAVTLYRQILQRTQTPSVALKTEAADVFSEYALSQPQALVLYQELLTTQPDDQSLKIKQLVLANKLGQISRDELYQQLQTVLQVLPAESGEQRSIAQALIRVDPPAPMLLATYQALIPANVPFLYFRIAQIQMQQNDLDAAKQALAAYSATPTGKQDLAPDLLLAEIDRREGNLTGSADRYQRLLAEKPKPEIYKNALRGLAGIRLAQGKLDESLSLYEQLLADNPDDLVSQLGRVSIGYQTGKTAEAEAEAEAVLDRWLSTEPVPEPPPELFNLVGVLPAAPARQPLYEALLTVQPNDFAVNRRLVQVLAASDPELARQRVEQLVQNNPDDPNVYFVQGDLAQMLGDLSLASQAYETILAKQPDNVGALSALGGVRFQERRYQDAVALYNQVLSLQPHDLETQRVLAELSAAQDQPIAALDQLRRVDQLQTESGVPDPRTQQRIQQLEIDLLRRRGFQPEWERY